jgi:transposase, IS30 family
MPRGYTHLTRDERCQIYALKKSGMRPGGIARELGRDPATIRREIARNSGARGYRINQAQEKAQTRRHDALAVPRKMIPEVTSIIEEKLTESQWSPQQISGWLRKTTGMSVSHERIYRHVWEDKKKGGTLYKHLRHNGKKYNKRRSGKAGRGCIPNRTDIDQRPEIVNKKERIGDWELDTIIGAEHGFVLVSAVERASKYMVLCAVRDKSAAAVTDALIERLGVFQEHVLTLTADNGKEFAGHGKVANDLKADFYFAKPYHSWERGLNEHTNGLVRQYIPKKRATPPSAIELDKIETLLNNRPRKILGFNTPQEVFSAAIERPPPNRALHC